MATDPTLLDRMATERALARRNLEAGPDPGLGQSIVTSLGASPDEVAAARALSKRSGLPLPVAKADPKRAEREAQLREIDLPTLPQRSPATARSLRDREIAQVAHDDVANMGLIERLVGDVKQGRELGKLNVELGNLSFDAMWGEDEGREFRIRQIRGQQGKAVDYELDFGGSAAGALFGIPGAVAETLPFLESSVVSAVKGGTAGAATGGGVGAVGGFAVAGPPGVVAGAAGGAAGGFSVGAGIGLYVSSAKTEAGLSFDTLRGITDANGEKINPAIARNLSLTVGAVAGAVEMWGTGKLLERIPGVRRLTGSGLREAAKTALSNPAFSKAVGQIAAASTASAATEGLTEGLQEFIAITGEIAANATGGKGLDDFTFEAPNPEGGESIVLRGTDAILARVLSATAQGAQAGAGIGAAGRVTQFATDSERARSTFAKVKSIARLTKATTESKLRERDPEAFRQHANAVADESKVENVYVEPQAMRTYFESIDPEEVAQLFQEIPALREQQEEIARTGADVVLRLEDWLLHPEMAEALGESVRFDPLDMTGKEALGFQEDLEKQVGSVQEIVAGAKDEKAALAALANDVRAQLLKVHPATVVEPMVDYTVQRYATRAARLGKPVAQLLAEEGLFRVEGPQTPDERTGQLPPTLEETLGGIADSDRVRAVLGDLRAARKPEQKGMSQRPLLEALRDLGGVDPTGDLAVTLRELGIPDKGKGSIKGLFREGGIGAGDNLVGDETEIFTELVDPETGYVDPRKLELALSNEVAGKPLRTQAEGEVIAGAEGERTLIREAMEAAGLTLEADDDAIVAAVSGRTFEQPAYHGTPHRFDGKFSLDAIGSGEGVQAFGWGLYFSSDIGVAKSYVVRDFDYEQKLLGLYEKASRSEDTVAMELLESAMLHHTVPEMREKARSFRKAADAKSADRTIQAIEKIPRNVGQLFEVALPDNDVLLNWDRNVNAQPDGVKKALKDSGILARAKANRSDFASPQATRGQKDGVLLASALYSFLEWELGSAESASKALLAAGIQGHRYGAGQLSNAESDATNFVIYDADAIKTVRTFYEDNRGAIRMTDDLAEVVIRFTEATDLSTFIHESGHLFLAQLNKDAANAGGALADDLAEVQLWAGSDDVLSTEVQEKWARAYEAYVFEGKAPSLALDRVFARFSSWLIRIYKRLRGIPGYQGDLTPEIRAVMDRLIATDEQIAEAHEANGFLALDPAALGLTPEQTAEYEKRVGQGRDEARRRLQSQLMGELARQKTKEWGKLRESVRAEVEADVNSRPVFQAKHWLSRGKALEGQPIPIAQHAKLDRGALVELYGKEITKALPSGRLSVWQKKDGYHPDAVAEIFGFQNGDDLVRSLQAAGDRVAVIEQEADALMLKRHGRFQTRDEIEAAALEALMNDKQLKALETAERAIATKAGGKVIPIKILRSTAERLVSRTRYRDLNPAKYRAAATKASREAIKLIASGDYPGAQIALRHQITNLMMEAEARRRITEADKATDYLNRVQSKKSWERIGKAGHDYQEQIEGLLARFDLRTHQSLRKIDKLHGLASWIAEQEAQGETVIIPPKLRDEAFRQSWKELTIEDLMSLRDSVKNIEHLARRKNEFLANREQRYRESVQAVLVVDLAANLPGRNVPNEMTPGKVEQLKRDILSAEGSILKMEFLIDMLDKGDPMGSWRANVFTPIAEAQTERYDLSREYTEKFGKLMAALVKDQRAAFDRKWMAPQTGQLTTKWNVIGVALNVGNDGNYANLVEGNKLSDGAIKSLLDQHMTKPDWEFVRETWKLIDTLWPRIAEQERRLTGVVPEKVKGRTVVTPFGEFEGGYFPIVRDPDKSQSARRNADKGLYEGLETSFQRAITGHGHTIERTGAKGALLLDLAVIPSHLDQVIHDLTHREVLMQIDKLLQGKEISAAFAELGRSEWYDLFRPWLQGIAKDRIVDNRSMRGMAKILSYVRTSATSFTLGLRATTLLLQTTGHSNAMGQLHGKLPNYRHWMNVGRKKVLAGGRVEGMKKVYGDVLEVSGEMRHRIANLDRDLRDVIRRNQGKVTAPERARTAAMELIGQMQMFGVDLPVWVGAYEGAVMELGYEHEQAVIFADSIIRMSQGSAGAKDLSAIQRADEGWKQFLTFFTYRNLVYNQVMLAGRRVRAPKDVGRFLAAWAFSISIPFVLASMIREGFGSDAMPGDEDDGLGDWLAWFLGGNVAEFIGTIPYASDLAGVARLATGEGRYFVSETPTQRAAEAIADLAVPRDEIDLTFDALRVTALLTGMPADWPLKLAEEAVRGDE